MCSFNSFASPVASPASSPSISSTLADVVITIDKEEVINALNDSVKINNVMQGIVFSAPKFSLDSSTLLRKVTTKTTLNHTIEQANAED